MDDLFPYYFLSILGFLFMFSLVGVLVFYALFIYFLSPVPHRLITAVLVYKVYLGSILFGVVGIGGLLNDFLAFIGFRADTSFYWNLHNVRQYILYLIVSVFLYLVAVYKVQKGAYNLEIQEKKDAVSFTSHVCHYILLSLLIIVMSTSLFMLLDYLLGFILSGGYQPEFKDFLQGFVTVFGPAVLLYGLQARTLCKPRRIMPKISSVPLSIFYTIVLTLFVIPLTIATSMLLHDIVAMIYSAGPGSYAYNGTSWDNIRNAFVLMIVSLVGITTMWKLGKLEVRSIEK